MNVNIQGSEKMLPGIAIRLGIKINYLGNDNM